LPRLILIVPSVLSGSSVLTRSGGACLVSWSQKELVVPAVEGTLNVLRAAKDAGGVRRVVVTSSISALVPSPGWPAGEVRDERCWTDIDYCEKNGVR
jgi:nucleoside-diphosphate-sugar epimerase